MSKEEEFVYRRLGARMTYKYMSPEEVTEIVQLSATSPGVERQFIKRLAFDWQALMEDRKKLVEALQTIKTESTDEGARECADYTLKELGVE